MADRRLRRGRRKYETGTYRKPSRFRLLTQERVDVGVGGEVAREDALLFPIGQTPLDVRERLHDLPERRAVHLLNGPETGQFATKTHDLARSLLGPTGVQPHQVHAAQGLVFRVRQRPLAVGGALVGGGVQTGAFEELFFGGLGSEAISLCASSRDLAGGNSHDLGSAGFSSGLEL